MTFRLETSPKDSNEDERRYSTDGGKQNPQQHHAAKISTIYDSRLQCTHHSAQAQPTTFPAFNPVLKVPLYNPKKSLIEKIKRISHKLHSSNNSSQHSVELDEAQKRMRVIKFVCLGVLLACYIAVMVCAWIFMYSPIQLPDRRHFIVDGEFQILNRDFEPDMLNKESSIFKELAFNLTYELNRLFKRNERDPRVAQCYQRNEVLEITPNMTVKSIIGFRNCDNNMNVGRIGLAFLRSLRLRHGHTYLGHHVINVQSIGFTVRGEEGVWGEWSDWKGCESPDDAVATRTRHCLTRDTFQVTNVDRCLLIPGNKGDLDIIPCRKYRIINQQKEIDELTKVIFNDDLNDIRDELPISIPVEDDIEPIRI